MLSHALGPTVAGILMHHPAHEVTTCALGTAQIHDVMNNVIHVVSRIEPVSKSQSGVCVR